MSSMPALRRALELAAERVRRFHQAQPVTSWITQAMGGTLGQLVRPIRRVGMYVPAGSAPLPSSVLMSAIPAQVAGVTEIVLVAPPQRGIGQDRPGHPGGGRPAGDQGGLCRGRRAGDRRPGLWHRIASRAVDKIFGPGNLFVTLAKRQVFGVVGIDWPGRADRNRGDRRRQRPPRLGGGRPAGPGRTRRPGGGHPADPFAPR